MEDSPSSLSKRIKLDSMEVRQRAAVRSKFISRTNSLFLGLAMYPVIVGAKYMQVMLG